MSNAFVAQFDQDAHAAFVAAGIADVAVYATPAGAAGGWRRVLVDDARQMFGADGYVTAPRTTVGVLLANGAVEAGGTLTVDGATFTLQRIDESDRADGSIQWWVVTL